MTEPCTRSESHLVGYLRKELGSLERRWMEGHLRQCERCRAVQQELGTGLLAAREYRERLSEEHLERLVTRLAPYVHHSAPQPRRIWILPSLLGAASAAILLLTGIVWYISTAWPPLDSQPTARHVAAVQTPQPAEEIAVVREELTPYVRLLRGAKWQGEIRRRGQLVEVRLKEGFVVMSLAGGGSRRVQVVTPHVSVQVVGTRFFVEVDKQGLTSVGVGSGRVIARTGQIRHPIRAGETRSFASTGRVASPHSLHAPELLEDDFLRAHRVRQGMGSKPQRPRRARSGATSAPPAKPPPDVLGDLARAEALARQGATHEALALYQACLDAPDPAHVPYYQLCRYELAKLHGFVLGRRSEARQALSALVKDGRGEVQRQARLSLCELDRNDQPCRARACLKAIQEAEKLDKALRDEAERLLRLWGLATRRCEAVP